MLKACTPEMLQHLPQPLCFLMLAVLMPLSAVAQPPGGRTGLDLDSFANSEFLPVKQAYSPDAWFEGEDLVVQWTIAPGYYLYRDRTFFSASDLTFGEPVFAEGLLIEDEFFDTQMVVYYGETRMRLPDIAGQGLVTIEAQGCADAGLCYPPTDFWLEVDTAAQTLIYHQEQPDGLALSDGTATHGAAQTPMYLWLALIMAFTGGLILNLMPCVFPVLAIKALKIVSSSENLAHRAGEAGAYTAGVLVTVLSMAGILIALRAGGTQIGWGFQLQSPEIVFLLTLLFFVIGLSFSGWIQIGTKLMGTGQSLTEDGKPLASFCTGALAMVVASPCSAPFMAAALGYAIGQPALISLAVFASLGLGVATPLILLYLIPGVASFLPRAGAWMETLKQFLAFPMYLTCVWLIWVLTAQVGTTGAALVLASLCLVAMAAWAHNLRRGSRTWLFRIMTLLCLGCAVVLASAGLAQEKDSPAGSTTPFVLADLDRLVGGDRAVFLDVTADWCITCKFNEARVLEHSEIKALFQSQSVAYVVADWTNGNPDISALLDRYQRVGIPLYLYFPAGQRTPEILPQILTREMLRELLM